MSQGWFKLYRELFKKSIWLNSTPEQKVILITLLGMANHQGREWEWRGKQFKAQPGQFVTSIDSIIKQCGKGISEQNVKSAIKKFEKYEFLTNESTKTGRLITIVNWGLYQGVENESNRQSNRQVTDDQPTGNQEVTDRSLTGNRQVTPNKNDKNDKNDNKEKNDKEGKEGGEKTPQLPPLSFPTQIHEFIFKQFGETSYRTWFMNTEISESHGVINIKSNESFKKGIITQEYSKALETILNKKVVVS